MPGIGFFDERYVKNGLFRPKGDLFILSVKPGVS